jgi:asparagine synthase (glutamine-hydrolysing)
MCGIAGIVWPGNIGQRKTLIQRMTDAIAHRGPDAEGHYTDDFVSLGQRRLVIVDPSPEANQPFWDHSGRYVIVFNGMIYNYKEIRRELTGYPFRTNCDTEVILAAYMKWGEECLKRFYGMFAFVIWDTAEKKLFAVRDRMGIKPLYYYHDGQKLLFGSEIRAILASGLVPKKLSVSGVREYLTYQTVHAPNTIVGQVFQLKPGEYAVWQNGSFTKKTWWKLGAASEEEVGGTEAFESYQAIKKNVRRLMYESVERRLVADVPLGAFLSGGIDSSAVVALMSEAAGRAVDTFSVVFEEPQFDESQYAKIIADKFKTNHHPLLLKATDFLDALPDALRAMDAPSGDGVNTYTVSKVTKRAGITVALSGLGGDELFAGYSHFRNYWKLNQYPLFWKIPSALRKGGAAMAGLFLKEHQKARVSEIAGAKSAAIAEVYPAFRKVLTNRELGVPKTNGATNGKAQDAVRAMLLKETGISDMPLLSQLSVADISTYTQNVLLRDTDQMSMAHALEVRVPFFDHALVEYVLRIPDKYKYPDYPKKLLVESLHPLLPNEIVFRQKKGFDLPWKTWMKNELKDFCQQRLEKLADRKLVSPILLRNLWLSFLANKNDNLWSRIWIFAVLEDWLEKNLDQ